MYIKVTVYAGNKKEELIRKNETAFDMKVKEKAERNMANDKVCELIAAQFEVSRKKVRIINGHHSPKKMLSVDI